MKVNKKKRRLPFESLTLETWHSSKQTEQFLEKYLFLLSPPLADTRQRNHLFSV
jgi:hypothetical protein